MNCLANLISLSECLTAYLYMTPLFLKTEIVLKTSCAVTKETLTLKHTVPAVCPR